jgi:hypothetical protein
MPKGVTYHRAEFALPKVEGLAIHNAQLLRNRIEGESDDRKAIAGDSSTAFDGLYPELKTYSLYFVDADCSVYCVAGEDSSEAFNKMTRASNLAALALKYKAIGFVTCHAPATAGKGGKKKKSPTWDSLTVPAKGVQS